MDEVVKKIYKWKLTNSLTINIPFDHYFLLAMLDRNQNVLELVLSIVISALVSIFASLILCQEIYDDMLLIIFCFIVASCHYSLLKSVQPDSSSPIHGFNSLTALSRPIYFCLTCAIILILRYAISSSSSEFHVANLLEKVPVYGFSLNFTHFKKCLEILEMILLFFPVIFTVGLLPQISTFCLCVMEQCDMYLFGGTAMNNLPGAFLSMTRSFCSVIVLGSIMYGAIYSVPSVIGHGHKEEGFLPAKVAASSGELSSSVVFSIFSAFLVLFSYLLSRQTSDLMLYFSALKELLVDKIRSSQKPAKSKEKSINVGEDTALLKPKGVAGNDDMLNEPGKLN